MKHKKDTKRSKHKKSKSNEKHKKKHTKSRRRSTSSSSNSSRDEEEAVWVEKEELECSNGKVEKDPVTEAKAKEEVKREDWLGLNSLFPCTFNSSNEKKKLRKEKEEINRSILDQPGQSKNELNPYWRDGGNGLPQAHTTKSSTERCMDPAWLKKSLQRAREQADKEGRSLDEIAAERWGSLETIELMIAEAENARKIKNIPNMDKYRKSAKNTHMYLSKDHLGTSNEHRSKSQRQKYRKPDDDSNDQNFSYKIKHSSSRNWQKKTMISENTEDLSSNRTKKDEAVSSTTKVSEVRSSTQTIEDKETSTNVATLTEAELNKLGAKIVKAEIMGDTELANKLKAELEKARELTIKDSSSCPSSKVEDVILVKTDSKGVTRPLDQGSHTREVSNSKKRRVDTHVSGERVRHYFDDDKYSLHQLFQREKGRSVNEDDATFTKLASKNMDMDDLFEERIAQTGSSSKQDARDRASAINEHQRLTKSLDNCRWCVDSQYMLKHMIVAMDSKICLSLPVYVSLTEGHCILTPVHHISCQLQLDEDIWEQLKIYKQTLCRMFAERDQYPVFFEIYKKRHKFPHMQVECVPLPKEIGESAPLYFKKALLECETEWSVNKKIVDLKQKDLRRAVPKGLSYFAVQFGLEGGYAHVIEDEHLFPRNFAEEIIGGMLDLDHDLWRKPRKEKFEEQREKVLRFSEIWKKHDFGIEKVKN